MSGGFDLENAAVYRSVPASLSSLFLKAPTACCRLKLTIPKNLGVIKVVTGWI